jgi:hypothetical protein
MTEGECVTPHKADDTRTFPKTDEISWTKLLRLQRILGYIQFQIEYRSHWWRLGNMLHGVQELFDENWLKQILTYYFILVFYRFSDLLPIKL